MKIMATSFKRSHARTAALSAPNPAAGHHWHTLLLEAPGNSWTSLDLSLLGSLLPSPGCWCTQGFVCALQESVSPVLCKFWHLFGGINSNLLQAGLCHIQVCYTQSPCPCSSPLMTGTSAGYTQIQFWLSLWGLWVPVHTRFLWAPQLSLEVMGLILNVIFPLLPSFWGFSFALRCGVSFFWWDPAFSCQCCSAASCNFGVLAREDECKFFYSTIRIHCIG